MGKLVLTEQQKRVILPVYKQTDHTPAFYKDPFTNKLIPTAYFLKNLDEIGPQHWNNNFTSDFLLKIIGTNEIDYYCNYFLSSLNNTDGNIPIINCSKKNISASEAADITCHFNVMLFNYQQQIYNQLQQNHPVQQQATPPASPPTSPTFNFNNNNKQLPPSPSTSTYYFWSHTLVLATQSGFFNQLLGPINAIENKYPNFLTIPIPYPEVFEPILHWLYHHDDDAWLDLITLENFPKFYANVSFLKLGREAYDILDNFIEEAEEMGVDIDFDGIVEVVEEEY